MQSTLDAASELAKAKISGLIGFYVFGSVARGDAHPGSDIDLAFLARMPLTEVACYELKQEFEVKLRRDVDLIDLRRVSTVMRVRVLEDARLLFDADPHARALFEASALSDYARLNVERRDILEDIRRRGHIYG